MPLRIRVLALASILAAAAVLYTLRLNEAPRFLSNDETAFALQAHAIATTAHDENGRFLPLYFQMMENVWFHPALVYLMAPVLAVVPPTPWAVRLPTAIVAMSMLLMVYWLVRRLGGSDGAAVAAAFILALTPGHLMHGRLACDYLLPVPCVLAWMILLIDAHRTGAAWRFLAAGAMLGLGLYTYIASLVTMPMCLLLTYAALFVAGERRLRPYALVTTGFVVVVLPLAAYFVAVPAVYAGFVARYDPTNVDVIHQPLAVVRYELMLQRWTTYRSFFDWPFLFDHAETHVMSSTYRTGVLLTAMKVLVPLGLYHLVRNRLTPWTALLLAVFLSAPLAASVVPEPHAIDRALVLVSSAVIIGAFGVDWLLMMRQPIVDWAGRLACAALLIWMVVQFKDFYRDYLTDYPVRSSFYFDGNHPGAFDAVVQRLGNDDRHFVYLSARSPRIKEQWKRYLLAARRMDLFPRTVIFSQEDLRLALIAPDSLLLTRTDDPIERSFRRMNAVRPVARITEPDGAPAFTLFERTHDTPPYAFDGRYAGHVTLTCTPGDGRVPCASLAATAVCPAQDVITIANDVVVDSCGYLNEATIDERGHYEGTATATRIKVTGAIRRSGTFDLSGSDIADGNRYDLRFTLSQIE